MEYLKIRFANAGIMITDEQAQKIFDIAVKFSVLGYKGDFEGAVLSLVLQDKMNKLNNIML